MPVFERDVIRRITERRERERLGNILGNRSLASYSQMMHLTGNRPGDLLLPLQRGSFPPALYYRQVDGNGAPDIPYVPGKTSLTSARIWAESVLDSALQMMK